MQLIWLSYDLSVDATATHAGFLAFWAGVGDAVLAGPGFGTVLQR
jgi:hypothetical protein